MRLQTLLLLPLLLLPVGCVPLVPGTVRIPQMQVKETQIVSSTDPVQFALTVQVSNPNPFEVTLSEVKGDWILDGKISHTVQLPDLQLPAGGTASWQVNTTAPRPETWKADRTHTYRFDGQYRLQSPSSGGTIQPYTLFQGSFR